MKKRILIVDDSVFFVSAIKRMLAFKTSYEIETASDGEEAQKKFYEFNPDLIILALSQNLWVN